MDSLGLSREVSERQGEQRAVHAIQNLEIWSWAGNGWQNLATATVVSQSGLVGPSLLEEIRTRELSADLAAVARLIPVHSTYPD